ncbi:8-oxo-dGTP pyrophosphatase MutT (NUDIX family) [Ancylobacter polymorphus]|uniref:8-oxo-dGTP pyrophosphatase MutT (NUDIX family) n=2 Tax=Ancylobacter polymorphus TaxID=223390 RepID=A0ABU0BCP1_9HYPH|nr:8-oxo-dGTP pyrophosphatase MutT (NUDIX family) [Ancylobacter polymorphus]
MGENKHAGILISPERGKESADGHAFGSPPSRMTAFQRLFVRLAHRWTRLTRSVTLGVRAVVRNEDGAFLLLRHTYVPGWHLPGGGVDRGESAVDAVVRELFEEARITVTAAPRLHGLLLNRHLGARDHVAVYIVEHFERRPEWRPNLEIAEIGFFPVSALPPDTSPATRRRLAEVLESRPAAAHW